jgi:MFS transporter, MHS family, shikimate and dehydroshikimate transport protein
METTLDIPSAPGGAAAEVRYSGISVSAQLAGVLGVLGGGVAPMIATALLAAGGGQPHYVVTYRVALGLVALVCTALMPTAKS